VLDRELLAPATGAPNVQIWVFNAVIVIKPASMQNGGSRSYARSRLVTLGERLPGSFPVNYKVQERSCDPGTRDDRAERCPLPP